MRKQLTLGNEVATELAGSQDAVLRSLEDQLGCSIYLRGDLLTLDGEAEQVATGERLIEEMAELIEQGHDVVPGTVEAATAAIDSDQRAVDVLEDVVWQHRKLKVAPRSVNQKRYVDSIRENTMTFGIGPAGTGKTYLAIAMAVAALSRREVGRVILTRPAVEAGERLGFLPGDIQAKVDPYLRPLFDALYDMLEPDKVNHHLEQGVIEVAPLAFMRGRAQPVDQQVLTPSGFQPIGSIQVGDLVIGSDGRPTPVLGVYPQGCKQVFRVRAQDGSSTLCCDEHLWFVTTPDDRRHGKEGRVVQTKDMIGRLRRHHQHRFGLPLLRLPVEFEPCDVPIDPYALGLLLGDGCLTTSTTPSFTTADVELVDALGAALPGIELDRKSEIDYVLRNRDGHRGGVIVSNPVTTTLRELGLAGSRSSTKHIPDMYLYNSSEVRLAVLQGLLDSDGGPVIQTGRSCRIQYSSTSKRLADDVCMIVQSLGGVAYRSLRVAAGRPPGRARDRLVHHRNDSWRLEIRLPPGMEPFRLARKRDAIRKYGCGRPMRFVDDIEPAGEAETVCIQVAAPDSLYVTDDFLITHNTLNDSFIILDEAQNTSPEQMKMFLTRLGFKSKMVVTGDVTQTDLPSGQRSGLLEVTKILDEITDIGFVNFTGGDVVRHKLVQKIVAAYDERKP